MDSNDSLSRSTRALIAVAAAVIVLAGLKTAAPFLAPLFFGIFLAVIFGMLLFWCEQKGLSPRAALALTLIVFFAIIAVFILVIAGSFLQLLSEIPQYQSELEEGLIPAMPLLGAIGIDPTTLTLHDLLGSVGSHAGNLLGDILEVTILSALTFATTLFLLFEAKGFSSKLSGIIREARPGELERFQALARKNVDYLIIRTKVNLVMGIGTTVVLALIGVKFAVFWGFLAFLLGFVPYVGFWLAVIPPMLIAWFDLGPVAALFVLAGCGIMNLLAEYALFPHLAGQGLALSSSAVFISLVFWGWILGGIGVLLAVPLTLTVQLFCELFDETRWISVLLGPSPKGEKKGT